MHSAEPAGSTLRENRRYREIPPRFVTVRVYILNSRRALPKNSLATFSYNHSPRRAVSLPTTSLRVATSARPALSARRARQSMLRT